MQKLHNITTAEHHKAADLFAVPQMATVTRLVNSNAAEALSFLAVRPVQTIVMSSFIKDNGIESQLNRGEFFAYRNDAGSIEGIALIGHSTLVEARSEDALAALAVTARSARTPIHLIMSSGDDADRFWHLMKGSDVQPRLVCTEALFEVSFPFPVPEGFRTIANADLGQLLPIAEAQAELAFIECGIDPMLADREGFLSRVARRIEQNRVFTVFEDGKLIFKADIIAQTDEAIYLEGIYVHPEFRGQGIGSKCLASLTLQLLEKAENICLLSNVDFKAAHKSYTRAGYKRSGQCVTLFV